MPKTRGWKKLDKFHYVFRKGLIDGKIFKVGSPEKWAKKNVTWKVVIEDNYRHEFDFTGMYKRFQQAYYALLEKMEQISLAIFS